MQYMNSFKEGAAKALGSKVATWSLGLLLLLVYSYGINMMRSFETNIVDTAVNKALSEVTPQIERAQEEMKKAAETVTAKVEELDAKESLYHAALEARLTRDREDYKGDQERLEQSIRALTAAVLGRLDNN